MGWGRRARRIGAFLLLGAVVNVAVAWGCAAWSPFRRLSYVAMPGHVLAKPYWLQVERVAGFGAERHEIVAVFGSNIRPDSQGFIKYLPSLHSDEKMIWTIVAPSWSRLGVEDRAGRQVAIEAEHASGWPMRALWCTLEVECDLKDALKKTENADMESGILLEPRAQSDELLHGRRLPLIVLRSGFAANTLFYAATLWLLFAAPSAWRRRRRARRGLCAVCGYPVGASEVCTECGAAVASRSNSAVAGKKP